MPDMYGFRYEKLHRALCRLSSVRICLTGTCMFCLRRCTANENNQGWYRRRRVLLLEERLSFSDMKTFVSKTRYAVSFCTDMSDAEVEAKLAEIPSVDYDRIGERMSCRACICKLWREMQTLSLYSAGRKSTGTWKNSGSWMYRS